MLAKKAVITNTLLAFKVSNKSVKTVDKLRKNCRLGDKHSK